jgi:hypothetical protein
MDGVIRIMILSGVIPLTVILITVTHIMAMDMDMAHTGMDTMTDIMMGITAEDTILILTREMVAITDLVEAAQAPMTAQTAPVWPGVMTAPVVVQVM